MKLLVNPNSSSALSCTIDFNNEEWSCLLPENLSPFKMKELCRPCSSYQDGVFPNANKFGENEQITIIQKFPNYIEFSKIVSDECVPISGQLYLTTKFYDRRKEGWSSCEILKKEGDIIGYSLNGNVYCAEDKSKVDEIFYGVVYESLISKNPKYLKIKQMLNDGICITLSGSDENFLIQFRSILLSIKI